MIIIHIAKLKWEDHNITRSKPISHNKPAAYHTVYLRLSSFSQVDDIHSIVVEVLHAAMKVTSNKGSRFPRQWDPTKA